MDDRMLLHRIDFERNILTLDGKEYELKDSFLPTVDPADPYKLTSEEREIMNKLHHSFVSSEKTEKAYALPVPLRMHVHRKQFQPAVSCFRPPQ